MNDSNLKIRLNRVLSNDELRSLFNTLNSQYHSISEIVFGQEREIEIRFSTPLPPSDVSIIFRAALLESAKITQSVLFTSDKVNNKSFQGNFSYSDFGAVFVDDGVFVFFPPISTVIAVIDKYFREQFEKINAISCSLPSLLPIQVFKKNIKHNSITFLTGNNNKNQQKDNSSTHFLSHAACLPIYPLLTNKDYYGIRLYTSNVKCFRHEDYYNWPRLKEYQVREFVAVGDELEIERLHIELEELLSQMLEILGIQFEIKSASDSFIDSDKELVSIYQNIVHTKKEFIFSCGDKMFSFGSINKHGTFFSKQWNIKSNGKLAASLCVGFGLERIATAFFETHGVNLLNWPISFRHLYESYNS